jgi:polyisoprenoid-binding protein YceI
MEMKKIILSMLTLSTIAFSSCGGNDAETEKEVTETENVDVAKLSGTYHLAESSVVTWSAQSYKDTVPEHVGTVAISAGSIVVENDAIVGGEFSFDMASILESGEPNDYTVMLQNHLMDTSFFFVADFATSSFTITNVTDGVLTGNLEVLGISKEISFPIETTISAESIAAKANFDLNMLQFNLPYLVEQEALSEAEKLEATNPTVTFQLDISASKAAH